MEIIGYNKNFVKSLKVYLLDRFSDVKISYRYKNYKNIRGNISSKFKGVVLTAKKDNCSLRFETWGDSELVEATFIFGQGDRKKFFRSFLEIGTGVSGDFISKEFDFINKTLRKVSRTGNNALDFILS